jgi:hypothetical protein
VRVHSITVNVTTINEENGYKHYHTPLIFRADEWETFKFLATVKIAVDQAVKDSTLIEDGDHGRFEISEQERGENSENMDIKASDIPRPDLKIIP